MFDNEAAIAEVEDEDILQEVQYKQEQLAPVEEEEPNNNDIDHEVPKETTVPADEDLLDRETPEKQNDE